MILKRDNVERIVLSDDLAHALQLQGFKVIQEDVELKEDLEELTVKELKEKLDALGIEYDSKARKEDLIRLLQG